jgi:hypothetical protein
VQSYRYVTAVPSSSATDLSLPLASKASFDPDDVPGLVVAVALFPS